MIFGWGPLSQLRHLKRYRQILRILIKYGFAQVLDELNLYGLWERLFVRRGKQKEAVAHHLETRLRQALEELGPAFVKIGQLLSTRTDLLPAAYIAELSNLQDKVAPFPAEKAKAIIESELKMPLHLCFSSFAEQPLAAASIGQVHRAALPGGEPVAVKIKRPGVDAQIREDLAILLALTAMVDRNTSLGQYYHFNDLALELKKIILSELDYLNEARNVQRFRKNFADSGTVYIPKVYWSHTTCHVLTMELREGYSLARYLEAPLTDPAPRQLAEMLTDCFVKQIFIDGFFHGDPHPGNLAVLPDRRLLIMDFGAAGTIDDELRGKFITLLKAVRAFDTATITDELLTLAEASPLKVNRSELMRDIGRFQEQFYEVPLKNINLGEAFQNLMNIAMKHRLRLPYTLLLLGRTLVTLEGTIARLDPEFNIAAVLQKYGPSLQSRQLRFTARRVRGTLRSYYRLWEEIPERTVELLREAAAGDLQLKVELMHTKSALHTLETMINRLAFSIVLASLIIGLSQNLRLENVARLTRFPIAELVLIGAALAGVWWLFSIIRSGRF